MNFSKNPSIDLLLCDACRGDGVIGLMPCLRCRGMGAGAMVEGRFLFWGRPLSVFAVRFQRAKSWLHRFEALGALLFFLGFLVWFAVSYASYRLLWLSLLSLAFLVYRVQAAEDKRRDIEPKADAGKFYVPGRQAPKSWKEVRRLPRRRRACLAEVFSTGALRAVEESVLLAERRKSGAVALEHLFAALLSVPDVRGVFLRAGVSPKELQSRVSSLMKAGVPGRMPHPSADFFAALVHACQIASAARARRAGAADLLIATVRQSERVQEILYDRAIDADKLENVVAWIRVRERLRDERRRIGRAAAYRSRYGLDRAMTAVATPFLNAYSQDLTLAAKYGYLFSCVARDKEIEEILRLVAGGRSTVLLVGDAGVGKMSIVEGIAERMVGGEASSALKDKRLVQLSTSALLAGTTVSGAQERLMRMMAEIRRAKNVTLFINNVHDLAAGAGAEGLDVSETLSEYARAGDVSMFLTTTHEGFRGHIAGSELASAAVRLDIAEMSPNQAVQVLESRAGYLEYKQKVFFSYDALTACVRFATQFFHDNPLPESALDLLTEAGSLVGAKKGGQTPLVSAEDVASIVAERTGIPTASVSSEESKKLLALETAMHERIVGQDEAVSLLANALRRARAAIRSTKRPIAAFLFVGPTGVGKTELAKTIAEVYFGGEERMIRLDMSEFQDKASIYRLIGEPGRQGTGLLAEAVRERPFSLVLLDELEKADADVLNLFLQVFDDGRLTDSVGRVIDFTNTIIIATSNAGTRFIQEELRGGRPLDAIRDELVRGELQKSYRPELLNRFDGIVLFRPLEAGEIREVARRMLARVGRDLEARGAELRVEEAALDDLAKDGFDLEFGARPMRRAIQDRIENAIAQLILEGKLGRRDTVVIGARGAVRVERRIPNP